MSQDKLKKFQGALALSAIGDALGWPTELKSYPEGEYPIYDFVEWKKVVGGRYFGFEETIKPGSYSDDTQLTLAVARCIDEKGDFDPEGFAYLELPLWRYYERGGGKSIKTAADNLKKATREWMDNFYKRGPIEYRNAGGNGAAMRILPIALVNLDNEERLLRDVFTNSIITHGHPRAIIGAIIYAFLVNFILKERNLQRKTILEFLKDKIYFSSKSISKGGWLEKWIDKWDAKPIEGKKFKELFQSIRQEANNFLKAITVTQEDRKYYELTGAVNEATRGSGTSTVFVAIYLFLKYLDEPLKALHIAVNTLGSDTDTIANFLGGLFGAYYGLQVVPSNLLEKLQDKEYILKVAKRLYEISLGQALQKELSTGKLNRQEYPLLIRAWEIGLYEMFWDALREGDTLIHPILGRGKIMRKEVKPLLRQDYVVKLVEVSFECGQSCVFHQRLKKGESSILSGEFPTEESLLEYLAAKGLIQPAKARFEDFPPLKVEGKPLSQLLDEVRGNG